MNAKRQRQARQKIELEQLKSDANSFLALGFEDPILRKLETYRLYQAGYAAEDIAEAFGLARSYLYDMWERLKTEGVEALVDKRWGTAPRKRTPERDAQILRAKALEPERGDTELAQEFGLDRSTVYELLKEHGLQDLHRVIDGAPRADPDNAPLTEAGKKGG
jgi:transposase